MSSPWRGASSSFRIVASSISRKKNNNVGVVATAAAIPRRRAIAVVVVVGVGGTVDNPELPGIITNNRLDRHHQRRSIIIQTESLSPSSSSIGYHGAAMVDDVSPPPDVVDVSASAALAVSAEVTTRPNDDRADDAVRSYAAAAAGDDDDIDIDIDIDIGPTSDKNDDDGIGGRSGRSKMRKADRWKRLNQKKRDKRRANIIMTGGGTEEGGGGKKVARDDDGRAKFDRRKKAYDDNMTTNTAIPHDGSFANETMRKMFDVSIDLHGGGGGGDDDDDRRPSSSSSIEGAGGTTNDDVDVTTAASASAREEEGLGGGAATTTTSTTSTTSGVPKRKLAILVSFVGTKYSGFQINAGRRTLQAELELGLYRAGIISDRNFGYPTKYSWSNSARTDKGVHASAQVCSFKGEMVYHDDKNITGEGTNNLRDQFDAMRESVNGYLPDDVRVLDIEKVTRAFCARTNRDKVRYQYMVPSYMLCSREEIREAFSSPSPPPPGGADDDDDDADVLSDERMARARDNLVRIRVTPKRMEDLRSGLKLFEGTHNFHNYTRRLGSDDASSNRYVLSFVALDPIVVTGSGGANCHPAQWIPLRVVGQSFLLNQIRKMVSAAVDLARGAVSRETIERSLTKDCRMKVDVAPANGLFLDRSYFELYNRHKVKNAPKHGDKGEHNTLDWVEVEGEELPSAVRRIEEFKNEKIIPHIVREEAEEGNFMQYIYSHDANFHETYSLMGSEPKG